MVGLNDRELITALTAVILPLIVSFVQQPTWSSRTRAAVGFAGVLVWTLLGAIYLGDGVPQSVDWHAWVRLLLVNALISWGSFQSLWKPSGISQHLEAMSSPPSIARNQLKAEAGRKARPPRTVGD